MDGHVWWKCMHLDEKFFNKWCFWFKVWTCHKGQSYYHMTCLFQTSAKYKTFNTQEFIFWEKFTKSIFSFILWGQNFANFHTQQTHWFFSLLDSARELQLHLCNSMRRVSTIPGYIKTYCCFVLRAICGAEICSVLITFRREGVGGSYS
jgi:hypothetical protein